MATPQRKFPAEAGLPPEPQSQLDKGTPVREGRRRRSGYLWIILLLILGVWYVGFGWGNSGGWFWGDRTVSAPVANDGELSGSGVVILEVANKQDYIGQSFQVQNISVDHWSGNRAVWIGARHRYLPMLLVFSSAATFAPQSSDAASPGNAGAAESGGSAGKVQRLDVTGTLVKAPPRAQAQQEWNLSDDDVNQLEEEGVYIQAGTVQPVKH